MSCSFLPYNEVCDDIPAIYRHNYGKFPVCIMAHGDNISNIII